MDKRRLLYAPKAQRDLARIERRDALRILEDLELLESPPWPPRKVKRMRGSAFWEIKTGDFRTLFWPRAQDVVVLRIVNRRDLEGAIARMDLQALVRWVRERAAED